MPKKFLLFLGAIVLLSLLPIGFHSSRFLNILTLCLIWGVVAAAWDLSLGYMRVFNFAHIAFFSLGAYTLGMMSKYTGIPAYAAIPMGGALAAGLSMLIGLTTLRLRGIYVAMVTFAVHIILPTLVTWGHEYTGGSFGLYSLTPLQLGSYTLSATMPFPSYYFILCISVLLLFVMYKTINSRIGLGFMALRDSEPYAKSLGLDGTKYKLIVFGISSFIAGLMGAIYASYLDAVSTQILGLDTFLLVLIMVMLGGMGKFPGAVLGGFVIIITSELLRPLGLIRFIVLGVIVIAVMINMPKGLMGIIEVINRLIRRRKLRQPVT